jgi:hypothetical protein
MGTIGTPVLIAKRMNPVRPARIASSRSADAMLRAAGRTPMRRK